MPDQPSAKLYPHPKDRTPGPHIAPAPVPYAELQAVSNFSFLRGASHPDELVRRAAELGYTALAIADLHTLAGIVRAHVAAKDAGLQLIVGARVEVRVPAAGSTRSISLLLFPASREAYGRLSRMLTRGKRRAPKGECRLSFDDIAEFHHGLLAVLAPPAHDLGLGAIDETFLGIVRGLARTFDDDRLSLATSCLHGPDDAARLELLADLADYVGVPLVATNDVHYHEPGRRALQDVLTCIRLRCTIAEAGLRLFPNGERYLKPPAEMARLFAARPAAIRRSVEVAERAAGFSLDHLRYQYPEEVCPAARTPMDHLRTLTWRGAAERFARPLSQRTWYEPPARSAEAAPLSFHAQVPPSIIARVEHEFRLIDELGYAKYFLTVHDIVAFARARGILCQGRGAAANSAVCYCLGITSVDPSRIDLLFERFVSKERNEPPDIDIDFEHERREEVIQYIYARYGRERAALVAEVISYRGRSAVRDVGKALGLSLDCVDRMAKEMERWTGAGLDESELRALGLDPADPTIRLCIDLARALLGFPRHLSQHVGGFVISQERLDSIVPIENAAMPDRTVIEWDKDDVDAMGMLKIDCLGLGMLTCIRKALALLAPAGHSPRDTPDARAEAPSLCFHSIPPEDPAVYDAICRADTIGVFQIESRAQMSMLPRLRPRCFYDLVIEVAIVRPGPIQGNMVHPYLRRRNGEEPVEFPSEAVREVLGRTLGVPLFQEQAMRLAIVAAGFSPGEADQLRRAMAAWKRKGDRLLAFENRFIGGMIANGYAPDFARRCFEQLKGFSEYGFPESHAASFALLVYVSAWLKLHHPAAFAAAIINSQPMGFYAPAQIVRDAAEHGVEVLPIDVNHSAWDCTLDRRAAGRAGPALRLGARLCRGLAEAHYRLVEAAVAARGPFRDIAALRDASRIPVAALRRLAAADAFRSMGLDRRHALWQVRDLRDESLPLFDTPPANNAPIGGELAPLPSSLHPADLPPLPLSRHVIHDYAATGLSLKAHPISFFREELIAAGIRPASELRDPQRSPRASPFAVAGLVLVRQRPSTANGIVFMTIEDETGAANLIIRPEIFQRFRRPARLSVALAAWGRVERQGEVVHLLVRRLADLSRITPAHEGLGPVSRDFH